MTGFGLCLSRRVGQSVVIAPGTAHECLITVTDYQRGYVRLLFKAAPEVVILRDELLGREQPKNDKEYLDIDELGS